MNNSILNNNTLNEKQREAVEYTNGPSLILAGAGSGKTRVLTSKVMHLITTCNINPLNICMVTFTNKAAEEMKKRVGREIGFIGTFHSLCVRILRKYGMEIGIDPFFSIYDDDDQKEIMKEILRDVQDEQVSVSYVLNRISEAKNNMMNADTYKNYVSGRFAQVIIRAFKKYEKVLEKNNALDFDDLLVKTVLLFKQSDFILKKYQSLFRYILIDEFQDTNFVQYTLSKLLASKNKLITVVGDFSQSIYSWRGADMMNLSHFKQDFQEAQTFYLLENYRSTQQILDYAYGVISKNGTHPILNLRSTRNQGSSVTVKDLINDEYEALYIATEIEKITQNVPYSSIAVLYRTNAQSRSIEETLLHYGIPYVLIGGTRFYQRKEIKDILSYMRLLVNYEDELSKKRVIKIGKKRYEQFLEYRKELSKDLETTPTVDIMENILRITEYLHIFNHENPEDLGRLENIKELKGVAISYPNIIQFLEQVALVESEYSEDEKKNKNKSGVFLMTLHQAKGLEFPYVFISGVEDGILPHSRSVYDNESLEEERRLFYVGITRAKDKLYITYAKKRFFFGKRGYSVKSRFLEELEGEMVE